MIYTRVRPGVQSGHALWARCVPFLPGRKRKGKRVSRLDKQCPCRKSRLPGNPFPMRKKEAQVSASSATIRVAGPSLAGVDAVDSNEKTGTAVSGQPPDSGVFFP